MKHKIVTKLDGTEKDLHDLHSSTHIFDENGICRFCHVQRCQCYLKVKTYDAEEQSEVVMEFRGLVHDIKDGKCTLCNGVECSNNCIHERGQKNACIHCGHEMCSDGHNVHKDTGVCEICFKDVDHKKDPVRSVKECTNTTQLSKMMSLCAVVVDSSSAKNHTMGTRYPRMVAPALSVTLVYVAIRKSTGMKIGKEATSGFAVTAVTLAARRQKLLVIRIISSTVSVKIARLASVLLSHLEYVSSVMLN